MTEKPIDINETLAIVLKLRDRKKSLDEEMKQLASQLDRQEADLFKGMANQGMKSFKSEAFNVMVIMRTDMYVSVKNEDKPKLFEWLRSLGKGDLVREDIHYQTLKATIKEIANEQEEFEPPPFLSVFSKAGLTIRKSK